MVFVTGSSCATPRKLAVADVGPEDAWQDRVPVCSASLAQEVRVCFSPYRSTVTAAYEVSVSLASRSSAPAGLRFAEPRATARGLRHGCGPCVDPRLPRPPT